MDNQVLIKTEQKIQKSPYKIYLIGIMCSLVNLLLGYDTGVYSVANIQIKQKFKLTSLEEGISVGVQNLTAAIGCLLAGLIADKFGRKKAIFIASIFFLFGSGISAASFSYFQIVIGRIILGVGWGLGYAASPILLSELSPAKIRGALTTFTSFLTNFGIFLGMLVGFIFNQYENEENWRYIIGIGVFPPILIMIFLIFIPESPRWLVSQNKRDQAYDVVAQFNSIDQVERIVQDIELKNLKETSTWSDIFCNPPLFLIRIMILGWGIPFLTQATGVQSVVYYTPSIVKEAGIDNEQTQLFVNMCVGFLKFSLIAVPFFLSDRLGRKPVLLISLFGQIISSAFLGIAIVYLKDTYYPVIALFMYISTYSSGLSSLGILIPTEIFPMQYRGKCFGMALFINRISSGLVSMIYPVLAEELTHSVVFYIYSFISLIGFILILIKLPEVFFIKIIYKDKVEIT